MKLIIAIVQDEDSARLVSSLMDNGFGVTKLATTGGFLRAGNTTLLIGVDDEKLDEALACVERVCKSRKQIATAPTSMNSAAAPYSHGIPFEVTVGGAIVFILTVDQFIKM